MYVDLEDHQKMKMIHNLSEKDDIKIKIDMKRYILKKDMKRK